jgi:hypothetical protein
MADTRRTGTGAPVEGDGVNYTGILWFVVILTGVTVFSQLLVWGAYEVMAYRARSASAGRAPLAVDSVSATASVQGGRMVVGTAPLPQPELLVGEPQVLSEFRKREDDSLSTYGWIDRATGVVRIPIDRAKDVVIERGLPTRPGAPASPLSTSPAPAPARAATPPPAPAGGGH